MHYLHWNSNFETGILEIDGQHRRIMNLINRLHRLARQERDVGLLGDAMLAPLFAEDSVDRTQILVAIEGLIDYTVGHFNFEESLMEQSGHPATFDHCQAHQAFRSLIVEMRGHFEAGQDVLDDLIVLLGHWLFKHIARDDQELSAVKSGRRLRDPANAEFLMAPVALFEDMAA